VNIKPQKTTVEAPHIQSAAHPFGGSLIEAPERVYVPSWAMPDLRTTWIDRLGGHYGLCGRLRSALPDLGGSE
jgi:hypothetical protein